jgi:integrase
MIGDVDRAGASPVNRLAARLLALTAQRPGMVRFMEWDDITGIDWANPNADSSDALWKVPADKIKQELHLRGDEAFDHPVPLSSQAVEALRAVRWLTGRSPFVFPGARSGLKPISENAIGYLYNREGYKGRHVPHGWRSSFSTIMNEQAERELGSDVRLLADRMIIDLMLAHTPKGMSASELRYNRAAYMPRRRELAQRWADMVMEGAIPVGEVINSPRRRRR